MSRLIIATILALAAMALPHSRWTAPQAAWAIGTPADASLEEGARPLSTDEVCAIEAHLRRVFGNMHVRLEPQPPEADVFVGDAIVGVVYPYEDDGERMFYFEMAINDIEKKSAPIP